MYIIARLWTGGNPMCKFSDKFDSSEMIPIYASRISKNSFIGAKQKNVSNGKGPDTSERLFKLI